MRGRPDVRATPGAPHDHPRTTGRDVRQHGPGNLLDLRKPLVWGYFFTHHARPALEAVVPLLQAQGYRVIALYLEDKDDRKDPDLWWLHVEKTEVHTPDSLHERNQALYRFAEEHGLDAYDGMDVGAID
ncbi:ribonuclease E inhibitor RraB [Pseudoxanthomonas mexicana]|uniref:ribonuclease E inhibitor RraB n=1 Tax=Pseudoxanthomonas mexicana TaxID=128785 RepID=UPI001FD6A78B|nr:ribonuclease E inhibitor RraB [Pseudoxanthomonas mexicana]UOV05880.1 ribonuclease E inhibitor RraB [Pseudoxanthomonas mexicana]